jgi:hypothetical protein
MWNRNGHDSEFIVAVASVMDTEGAFLGSQTQPCPRLKPIAVVKHSPVIPSWVRSVISLLCFCGWLERTGRYAVLIDCGPIKAQLDFGPRPN